MKIQVATIKKCEFLNTSQEPQKQNLEHVSGVQKNV